mmetsp:Transcript_117376/g.295164  ORF Transcript_117376/g.295164 Transcript_117376/m.295164 type:complete len:292 (-) Transcript_117376:1562-2437(-)
MRAYFSSLSCSLLSIDLMRVSSWAICRSRSETSFLCNTSCFAQCFQVSKHICMSARSSPPKKRSRARCTDWRRQALLADASFCRLQAARMAVKMPTMSPCCHCRSISWVASCARAFRSSALLCTLCSFCRWASRWSTNRASQRRFSSARRASPPCTRSVRFVHICQFSTQLCNIALSSPSRDCISATCTAWRFALSRRAAVDHRAQPRNTRSASAMSSPNSHRCTVNSTSAQAWSWRRLESDRKSSSSSWWRRLSSESNPSHTSFCFRSASSWSLASLPCIAWAFQWMKQL